MRAEKDLEWNGMECSGIRLKNFFLRLNPPLAVKVNRKHCVGSLGFSFLVSLGVACPSPNTPIPHSTQERVFLSPTVPSLILGVRTVVLKCLACLTTLQNNMLPLRPKNI